MKRPRITIAHIILVVLITAIGLAAIRSGSASWAGGMLSITFFVMICSLLGVVLERGMWRVYWSGFATLGWSYLLLTYAPWLDSEVGVHLLAPNLFVVLAEFLHSEPAGSGLQSLPVGMLGATSTAGGFGGTGVVGPQNIFEMRRIGVSLEALLWAFLGGWVACYFASRRERGSTSTVAAPEAEGRDVQTR